MKVQYILQYTVFLLILKYINILYNLSNEEEEREERSFQYGPGRGQRRHNYYATQGKTWASHVVLVVKNLPASAGDVRNADSIPGLGRPQGEAHGNPLQYSCLENPMDRGLAGYGA